MIAITNTRRHQRTHPTSPSQPKSSSPGISLGTSSTAPPATSPPPHSPPTSVSESRKSRSSASEPVAPVFDEEDHQQVSCMTQTDRPGTARDGMNDRLCAYAGHTGSVGKTLGRRGLPAMTSTDIVAISHTRRLFSVTKSSLQPPGGTMTNRSLSQPGSRAVGRRLSQEAGMHTTSWGNAHNPPRIGAFRAVLGHFTPGCVLFARRLCAFRTR